MVSMAFLEDGVTFRFNLLTLAWGWNEMCGICVCQWLVEKLRLTCYGCGSLILEARRVKIVETLITKSSHLKINRVILYLEVILVVRTSKKL